MNSGFVKLYGSIVTSSIWLEPDHVLRLWIGMLALADANGEIGASVGGLAHACRLTKEKCAEGLAVLEAPDPDSRSDVAEGRRIEKIPGGWRIINHRAYRDLRTPEQVKAAERKADYRAGQRGTVPNVPRTDTDIHAEAEAEADVEAYTETTNTTPTTARSPLLAETLTALRIAPHKVASWTALLEGMAEGSSGPAMRPVPWPTLLEAAVELSTAPGDVSAHRYKTYVDKVLQRQSKPRSGTTHRNGKGSTTRALKLIEKIRDRRNPLHPNSVLPDWQTGLTAEDARVCRTFGLTRILNDQNEGTMVAQLTKALEESAHA